MTAAALAGCGGCGRPHQTIRQLAPDAVVLAFGDSLTLGTGAEPAESYPAVLSARIGRPVINAGIAGETSAAGVERLRALLDRHRPALVVLCHGGNDFLRGMPPDETRRNLDAMIVAAGDAGAQVILVGVPRPGLWLRSDPLYRELACAHAIALERDVVARVLSSPALKSDAIHPNADGYRVLAEALATLVGSGSK